MAVPGRRNGMIDDDDNDVEEGLFVDALDDNNPDTPLHLRQLAASCQFGDLAGLRLALDNLEGSIDQPVEDGDSALHLTCLYGHRACVELLLERGASLESQDEDGAIPLHDASAGGYTEIVELLINSAPNPECVRRMLDAVDVEGDTPLHHAARGEHAEVVTLLLSRGASPIKRNLYDKTPVELAEPGTEARYLLEAAANAIGFE